MKRKMLYLAVLYLSVIQVVLGEETLVANIPSTHGVSSSGAATYSIPIECPEGINGLTPNISIEYNSQAGNGLLGLGWNIGGLSAITKVPRSTFFDGYMETLDWWDSALSLDGNRLIRSNSVDCLLQEVDSKLKDNISSYKVYQKNGERWEYASENNNFASSYALTNERGPAKSLSYQLTKIVDRNGNCINYNYTNELSHLTDEEINKLSFENDGSIGVHDNTGLKYNYYVNNVIKYINYGSKEGERNIRCQLSFDYEDRPDPICSYIACYMNLQQKRLKSIRVLYKEEDERVRNYRTYRFIYTTKEEDSIYDAYYGISKLKQIEILGEDDKALSPIKIEWNKQDKNTIIQEVSCGVLKDELPYSNSGGYHAPLGWCAQNYRIEITPLDYNNDGLTDLLFSDIVNTARAVKLYLAKKDEQGKVLFKEDEKVNYYISDYRFSVVTGRFESVSKPSILIKRQGEYQKNRYYFNKIEAEIKNIRESESEAYYSFALDEPIGETTWMVDYTQRPFFCSVVDINNDGYDDIITLERAPQGNSLGRCYTIIDGTKQYIGEGIYTYRVCYGGGEKGREVKRTLKLPQYPLEFFVFDMDGDKLKDLVILTRKGLIVEKNTGTINANIYFNCVVNEGSSEVFQKYAYQQPSENINADNKNYWKICYDIVRPGDFNGDGLIDLFVYRDDVGGGILYNNGHYGFEDVETIENLNPFYCKLYGPVGEEGYRYNLSIYDMDGNGLSDICVQNGENAYMLKARKDILGNKQVVFDKEEFNLPNYWTNKITSPIGDFDGDGRMEMITFSKNDEITLHSASAPFSSGKVSSITDPMGNICKFKYKSLTDSTIYKYDERWNNDSEQLSEVPVPLVVMSECEMSNGAGSKERNTYRYEGALRHAQGRGFLGFRSMTITDEMGRIVTQKENAYDSDHKVLYPSKEIVKLKDGTPVKTTVGISQLIDLGDKRYRITSGNTIETDHLTGVVTRTNTTIDTHGNVLERTVDNGTVTETVQLSDYVSNGSWCEHLPGKKVLVRTCGEDTYTQTTLYVYDERGNLTKETINPNTDLQLTNAYEYDRFGNCTKQSTTGSGRTLTKRYWYDDNGWHLTKSIDEYGMTTKYAYSTSHLVRQTDRYGVTNITNDALGRPVKTGLPNGAVQTITYQKKPYSGVGYWREELTTGAPTRRTLYNIRGEVTGTGETKANGAFYYVRWGLRYDGKVSRVTSPIHEKDWNKELASQELYAYDKFGRPSMVQRAVTSQNDLQKTTITYSGLKIKTESPEETIETELDNAGQQKSVTTNGKRVDFTYYANGRIKTATPQGGTPVTFEYDINGNQTKMVSDEETITSVYDAFGNVTRTTQDVHRSGEHIVTEYTYNAQNLLVKMDLNGEVTTYSYDDKSRLYLVASSNGHQIKYEYNIFDWLLKKTETIDGKEYTHQYGYDQYGNITKETYPSGYSVLNTYNEYGYLQKVESSDGTPIWAFGSCDTYGRISNEKIGNAYKSTGYAPGGMVTSEYGGSVLCNMYAYKDNTTLMKSRSSYHTYQQEQFTYDSQNRLTDWNICRYQGGAAGEMLQRNGFRYNTAGDIALITATGEELAYGEYGYPKHAVTSVTAEPDTEKPMQEITYTDFKKVSTIDEGNKHYELFYGTDHERRKSVYADSLGTRTRIYVGNYEKLTDSFGNVRELHYISGANGLAAIYVTTADKDTMYYAYTDYQQNLLALTDANGGKIYARYSYDPWGNRRSATDWTQSDTLTHHIINRGYTMHEHLDEFGLINMNGRMYDPKLACFLSPDPVISDAGNWLDYNRYSYAWGNPLKYCDPTGMSETEGDHQREHAEAEHTPSTEELVMKFWYDTAVGQKKEYTLTADGFFVDQYGNTLCGLPPTNADIKKTDNASANNSYDTGTTTPNTSDKKVTQPGGAPIGVNGSRGEGSGVHAEHEEEMIDWDGTGSHGGIRGIMQLVQKFFSPSPKVEVAPKPYEEKYERIIEKPIRITSERDTVKARILHTHKHGMDSSGKFYSDYKLDTLKTWTVKH